MYDKWQNEVNTRKALEQTIISLLQNIGDLKNKVKLEKNMNLMKNMQKLKTVLTSPCKIKMIIW